jgi:hypothetical protein
MKKDLFSKVKNTYGEYSSFALWNEDNIDDLSVIEKSIKNLHGRVIFVGYNASAQVRKFQNFHFSHRGGRDLWLAKSIGKQQSLRGSYMTDFFKMDFAKKESSVVVNSKIIEKNKKILEEEIATLGEKNCVLIAIGRKSEKVIKDCGMTCEYIPHYAGRISWNDFEQKVLELNNKL